MKYCYSTLVWMFVIVIAAISIFSVFGLSHISVLLNNIVDKWEPCSFHKCSLFYNYTYMQQVIGLSLEII